MDGRSVAVKIVRVGSMPKTIILASGESWFIAPGITMTNIREKKNRGQMTRLGFIAPQAVGIYRAEVRHAHERTP
jgi:sRNA-binding carbon storage regulator CsrA